MNDKEKSNSQLLEELAELRRRIAELETSEQERKKIEEALRESEEKYRVLFNNAPVGLGITDLEGNLLAYNEAMLKIGDYTREDIEQVANVGKLYYNPEDRIRLLAIVKEKGALYQQEVQFKRKDGTPYDALLSLTAVQIQGRLCFQAAVEDLTEWKETKKALQESEEQYKDLYENAPIAYYSVDREGIIRRANRHAAEMFGYKLEGLIGRSVFDIYADTPSGVEKARVLFEKFRAGKEIRDEEVEMRRADGSSIWISLTARPIRDAEGRAIASRSMAVDITHRRHTEREFVRLERLQALAEMGQGVAHNFNNLLVGVLGYAQLIEMRAKDSEVAKYSENIVESALRAKALVERLNRAIQGEKQDTIEQVSVDTAIQEAIQETRPRWKDEAEALGLAIHLEEDVAELPSVKGTQSGLQDTLINLLLNAVDALPKGGTITIAARAEDDEVRLSVSDTGIGMDEETRRRVFEPFFTTKADIGTGLGLSAVYTAVTRWGGKVEIESKPSRGTTVILHLPIWQAREEIPSGSEQQAADTPPPYRAKLLVVDDDEMVRQYLQNVLDQQHDVNIVSDGRDALEKFVPDTYDVVLIDLGMPGIPGDQVAEEMKKIDPTIATVLITGWAPDEDDPRLAAFDLVLQKPFVHMNDVFDVVTRAIEQRNIKSGEHR